MSGRHARGERLLIVGGNCACSEGAVRCRSRSTVGVVGAVLGTGAGARVLEAALDAAPFVACPFVAGGAAAGSGGGGVAAAAAAYAA